MAKTGRPSTYNREIADEICKLVSGGMTLNEACKSQDHFPPSQTFRGWVARDEDGLAERYARADQLQMAFLADAIVDISSGKGITVDSKIRIDRDRLTVDNLKWLLAKRQPDRYGDHLNIKQDTTLRQVKEDPEVLPAAKDEWVDRHTPKTNGEAKH